MKKIITTLILFMTLSMTSQELSYDRIKERINLSVQSNLSSIKIFLDKYDSTKNFEISNIRILEVKPLIENSSIFEDFGIGCDDYLVKVSLEFIAYQSNFRSLITEFKVNKILDSFEIDYIKVIGICYPDGKYNYIEDDSSYIVKELAYHCDFEGKKTVRE